MAKVNKAKFTERGLTNQSVNVRRDVESGTAKARMFMEVADEVGDFAKKLEEAHAVAEEAKADNFIATKMADMNARVAIEQDITPERHKAYEAEINKTYQEAGNLITLPGYKNRFNVQRSSESQINKIKLGQSFHTKFKDQAKAALKSNVDIWGKDYMTTTDPGLKQLQINKLFTSIDQQVSAGYMKESEALTEKQNTLDSWNLEQGYYDIENRAKFVVDELGKKGGGYYSDIDPSTRKTLLGAAQSKLNKEEAEQKADLKLFHDNNFDQAYQKTIDPEQEYGLSDARAGLKNGEFTTGQYIKLEKRILSPDSVNAKTDFNTYANIRDMIDEGKSQDEVRDAINTADTDGKLNGTQSRQLYDMALKPEKTTKDDKIKVQRGLLKSKLEQTIFSSDVSILEEPVTIRAKINEILFNFDQRLLQNPNMELEAIEDLANNVLDDELRKIHPELEGVKNIPDIVLTQDGRVKRFFSRNKKAKVKPDFKIVRATAE